MVTLKSRRAVVRVVTAAMIVLIPGCSDIVQSLAGPPPDVVVFNKTDQDRTPKITIDDQSTGNTVLSVSPKISAGEAAEYPDALDPSNSYTLSVETESGPTNRHQWSVSSDDHSMQARIKANSITFREVSP